MTNNVASLLSTSDTEQIEVSSENSTRRTAQDARAEIDRFYAILSERLQVQSRRLYIALAGAQGKTKLYLLIPRQKQNDPVRAWAMERYAELYPDAREPLIRSYETARSRLERETDILEEDAQGATPEPEQDEPQKGRRGNRRSSLYASIIQAVEALADWTAPAREIGVRYARVPYTLDNPDFTGIWKLDPEKPYRLLDCAISFKDINRPHAASKSADYSGTLIVQNAQGDRKEIQFSRDEIEDKGLDAKLIAFADWPHMPSHKYHLLDALKLLMREQSVIIRDQYTSLGYAEHPELGLVWVANNGVETAQGFLPSEQAPFIAPSLLSPGNGYRALTELPEVREDLWSLLLGELNPDNWARMYGKLGAALRVQFPDGTVERAGKLDFVIETIGEGSGQGKSAEDNYVLSLFGADFAYNRPPLISTDDTAPSRPRLMEAMRYCAFMTEDRKAREHNPQFMRQHESRKKLIEQYADNTGGGVKMTAYGRHMVSRGNPQGLALLTGNADHSAYALRSDAGEEEATEWRACTFLLAKDERADYDASRQIDARREELTAWGTRERRWMMQRYNADKPAFMLYLQTLRAQAEQRVQALCPEWPHTRPMNACIDMVWGMLARAAIIEDLYPETYQDSYLWNWIQTFTEPFIENRLERARYLQSLIDARDQGANLGDFVLDALRYLLGTSQYYIASQQERLLCPDDVPLSLTKFGMKLDQTVEGNELWRPGQHGSIGYYLARQDTIALNYHILYPALETIALKQRYPLPTKQDFKRKFAETDVPIVKRDEDGTPLAQDAQVKVSGKNGRYILLPLQALYPVEASAQDETDEEEELLQLADTAKVTPLRRPEPETVAPSSRTGDRASNHHAIAEEDARAIVNGSTQEDTGVDVSAVDFDIDPEDIPEEELFVVQSQGARLLPRAPHERKDYQ